VAVIGLVFSFWRYQNENQSLDSTEFPPPGVMVDIGATSIHMNCIGTGSPTVILEHGIGANSLDWSAIQPEISPNSTVCAYDRAGYGWSEPSLKPRTASYFAEELHKLIEAGGLRPPFIFVSHSFGGVVATSYIAEYSEDVAGLVLIDAIHPGMFGQDREPFSLTPVDESFWYSAFDFLIWLAREGIIRKLIPLKIVPWTLPPENLPEQVAEIRTATLSITNHWSTFKSEMRYVEDHMNDFPIEDLRGIMDNKPVYVFYGGESAPIPVDPLDHDESEFVWESFQSDWKMISTNCHFVEIKGADHNSLLFNPQDYHQIVTAISELQADFGDD
jgi:pimeloyl-ACP methyl ester carboxylesterase